MTRNPFWHTATLLLALNALAAATPIAPAAITLKPRAQVSAAMVLLSDVAEVLPPEAAQALAGVELGPAPAPGVERTVTAGYVKVRLRRAGVDLDKTVFQGERTLVICLAPPSAPAPAPPTAAPRPGDGAVGVKSGAKVTLVVQVGGLRIATEAEAVQACYINQEGLFRVRETRALVRARLISHDTAEVIR